MIQPGMMQRMMAKSRLLMVRSAVCGENIICLMPLKMLKRCHLNLKTLVVQSLPTWRRWARKPRKARKSRMGMMILQSSIISSCVKT